MNSDIVVVLHKVSASPVLATVEGRKLSLTELEISFEEPKGGGGKLPSSGGSLYDDSSDSEYGPTEDEDDSDEESDCGDFDEEYIDWEDDDFDDPGGGGGGGGGSSPSNKFMLVNSLFHSSISYILNFEQDGDDDDEGKNDDEEDNVPQEPVEDGSAKHFEEVDTRDNGKCVEEESSNAAVSVPESITKLDQDGINKDEAAASATEDCNAEDSFDLLFGGLFLDSLFRRSTSPEPPAEAAELSPEAELVDNVVENIISPPNAGLDLPLTMEEIKRNIEMLQLADEEGKLVAVAVTEANRKWNCVHVQSVQLVDIETSNLMRKKISFNIAEPKDVRIFERLPQELLTPEPPRWLRPSLEDDLKAEAMMAEYLEAEPEELIFDLEF